MRSNLQILEPAEWMERQRAHEARVRPWIAPRLSRRARGERHPVDDFLFDYYSYRPGQLRCWHPGIGVVLAGTERDLRERTTDPDYERVEVDGTPGITASVGRLARHRERLALAVRVLAGTASREPRLGCFGLHEWAMVYRVQPNDVRHNTWPMRLTSGEIESAVESIGLRCTHIDAYRFFSPAALPLNEFIPTRAQQPDFEQPGCLHAAMDLYRWSFLFSPFVSSDIITEAFDLARQVREVDMRASPYDFSSLGLAPIAVETAEGRREFVHYQRALSDQAANLRHRVLPTVRDLLGTVGEAVASHP